MLVLGHGTTKFTTDNLDEIGANGLRREGSRTASPQICLNNLDTVRVDE